MTGVVARTRRAHVAYLDALDERDRRLARSDARLTSGSTLRDVQELLRRVDHLRATINRTPVDGLRPRWDVFDEYLDEDAERYWRSTLTSIDEAVEDKARALTRLLRDQELLQRVDGKHGTTALSTAAQMELTALVHQRITESRAGQLYVRWAVPWSLDASVPGLSRPLIHPDRVAEMLADSPLSMPDATGLPQVAAVREAEVLAIVPPLPDGGAIIPAMQLHTTYVGEVLPLLAYAQLGYGDQSAFAPLVEQALAPLYPTSVFAGTGTLATILGRASAFDSSDRGAMFGGMGDILGALRGLCTFFDTIDRVARNPTSVGDLYDLTVAAFGSLQDARSVVTSLGYITQDTAKTLARRATWISVPLLAFDTVTNLQAVREALADGDYGLAAGTLLVAGGTVTVGLAAVGTAYGWGVFAGPVGAGIVTAGVLTVFIGQSLITLTERGDVELFSRNCMFGANRQTIRVVPLSDGDMPAPGAHDFAFHDPNGRHDPVRQLHALQSLAQPLGLDVNSGSTGSNAYRYWTLARHNGSDHPLGPGAQRQVLVMTDPPTEHTELDASNLVQLFAQGAVTTFRAHQGKVIQLRVEVPREGMRPLVLYDDARE